MIDQNLKLLRIIPPIALGLIALLWVTDAINQTAFITLVIVETAVSMLLTIYLVRKQRNQSTQPDESRSRSGPDGIR